VVTGVSGSGKSTLCGRAAEALEGQVEAVNFGEVMVEVARAQDVAPSLSELRATDMQTYRRVMLDACDEVASRGPGTLLDTRCLIVSNRGYLPGLPAEILLNLAPSRLVLIEGDPSEILARRRKAQGKPWYGKQAQDEVALQQELARSYVVAGSCATGAPLLVISNRDGQVEEALDTLVQALRDEAWIIQH